ncbi:MAG: glycosyltransferase family 39 protein [Patescibacteria group bacterium]
MFKTIKPHWYLLAIFLVGLFLRLFQLGLHPINLNRDELAVGYNSYSLTQTAHDEHGQGPWPIIFKSFGDYKLPGLIYLSYWPIKWFGLNAFSVRLPNALIGSGLILIVYFLAQEIFSKKSSALIASFFITFSFWHIIDSRAAYEPISALSLSALSYLFLLRSRRQPIWLLFSVLTLAISFFFYNSPLIFAPLIFAAYILWNRHDYNQYRPWVFISIVTLLVSIFFFMRLTAAVNQAKINTTLFSQPKIIDQINQNTHYLDLAGFPLSLARVFSNKPLLISFNLVKNYLSTFDFTYLFATGDNNPWHNLANINLGDLNLILLPLFLIGIYQLIRYRSKTVNYKFLVLLLLISPLANTISVNVPVTNRLMDFHLSIELISVYGFLALAKRMRILALFGYLSLTIYFLISYWFVFPYRLSPLWNDQAGYLMQDIYAVKDNYDHIYITPELDFGYIYFIFYNQYAPELFQRQADWINDPMARVVSLDSGKYFFDMVNLDKILLRHKPGEKLLLVNRGFRIMLENPTLVFVIKDINAQVLWKAEAVIVPQPAKL